MTRGASAVCLRQNALAEPLDNQWSAWPYLVSPITAPMSVGNLHLRLMESFVANPQVHTAARKNPAMAGGPSRSHDESKVSAVARRYETQCTRFVRPPGMALRLQVIDEDRSADLDPSDLQRVSLEEQSRELDLLWDDLWSESFELQSGEGIRGPAIQDAEIMGKLDSLTRELDTSLELRRIVFGIPLPGKGGGICRS